MRIFTAVFVALMFQAAQCAAEPWQTVKPDGLGFSVEFPEKPNIEEEDVDIGEGKSAKMRTFQIRTSDTIYDVTIAQYPQGTMQSIGEQQVLDNARNGAVNNAPGPLLSETKMEFAGHAARELLVDMTMGLTSRSRVFVLEDRLFNVGAITRKDNQQSANIEKFFGSFKLTDSPKP